LPGRNLAAIKIALKATNRRARRSTRLMDVIRTNKTEAPDTACPDPKAVEAIGRALAAHYADLVQAPLPDKFAKLLARLEIEEQVPAPQGRRDAVG
jgi:Anti-sigma factor NepR